MSEQELDDMGPQFKKGYEDYTKFSKPANANPYMLGSPAYDKYRRGWLEAYYEWRREENKL